MRFFFLEREINLPRPELKPEGFQGLIAQALLSKHPDRTSFAALNFMCGKENHWNMLPYECSIASKTRNYHNIIEPVEGVLELRWMWHWTAPNGKNDHFLNHFENLSFSSFQEMQLILKKDNFKNVATALYIYKAVATFLKLPFGSDAFFGRMYFT